MAHALPYIHEGYTHSHESTQKIRKGGKEANKKKKENEKEPRANRRCMRSRDPERVIPLITLVESLIEPLFEPRIVATLLVARLREALAHSLRVSLLLVSAVVHLLATSWIL